MTTTWPEQTSANQRHVRLRLVSLGLASAVCASLSYLAVTQHFGVIADWIDDGSLVTVVVEPPREPPPPPLVHEPPPRPQVQRATPQDTSAPPMETLIATLSNDPPPQLPSQSVLTNATFLQQPSGRDFERFYPPRALARGQGAEVILDCVIDASGRMACAVASETPAGWGFGEASLHASRLFRVAPATIDGRPTSGGRLRVPMTWRVR